MCSVFQYGVVLGPFERHSDLSGQGPGAGGQQQAIRWSGDVNHCSLGDSCCCQYHGGHTIWNPLNLGVRVIGNTNLTYKAPNHPWHFRKFNYSLVELGKATRVNQFILNKAHTLSHRSVDR